jgi:hypothetical protein
MRAFGRLRGRLPGGMRAHRSQSGVAMVVQCTVRLSEAAVVALGSSQRARIDRLPNTTVAGLSAPRVVIWREPT